MSLQMQHPPFCRLLVWPKMAALASAAAEANGFCMAAGAAKPTTLACGWVVPFLWPAGPNMGPPGTSSAACVCTGGAMPLP